MVLRILPYSLLMVVCCSECVVDEPSRAEQRGLIRARSVEHLRQEIPELPKDVFERDWRNVVSSTSLDMPGFHDQIPLSETVLVSGVVLGSDGIPAAGTEVWASGVFADVPHRERAVANERGEFQLHLKPLQGEHERWIVRAFRDDEGASLQDYVTIRSVADKAPHLALLLQPQGRLLGSVVATETLEPISNAHIFLEDGRILVTDSAGKFSAGGIKRSQLDLAVVKPGRMRRYVHFDTSRLQDTRLQIRLAPAGLISGRVQNTNGKPIRDAVVAMGSSGSAIVMESQKVRSDDNGYFVFHGIPLNSVRFRIDATAHGMSGASLGVFAIHDRAPYCFHRFVLRSDGTEPQVESVERQEVKVSDNPLPTRTLSGIVVDENDKPIAGASVRNGATFYEARNITCTTDQDGRFALAEMPVTNCFVSVNASGFAPLFEQYPTDESELTLTLDRGRTIGGVVVSPDGKPLSRVSVIPVINSPDPRLGNPYWLTQIATRTNDRGEFSISGLPSIPVRFDFLAENLSEIRDASLQDSNDNEIQMSASGAIRGRVLNAAGRPIHNFRIRIDFPEQQIPGEQLQGFTASLRTIGVLFSDDDGWFQLSDLPANAVYRVTADAAGYGEVSINRTMTIPVNEITDDDALELVLGSVCPLHVRVLDGETQLPISGASVFVNRSPRSASAVDWSDDLIGQPTLLSDQWGCADFSFPQSGGVVCVQKTGYARASIKWAAGSQSVDIVLDPESRVHVSIQANNGKPVPGCRVRLTDLIGSNISAEPIQDGAAEFEIGELAAGAYELTVSFENRELERLRITLKQGQTVEIPVTVDE